MTATAHDTYSSDRLRFAVMGAGSVGCYFGTLLARAGHQVTLIGRPAHVQAIQARGLRLQTATEDIHVPISASTDPAAITGADVVLLSVKSTDTESAARQIQPHLGAHTLVLTLQNGVDNDERVRSVLGPRQPVGAAVVYVATAMAGPGHVRHYGRGDLLLPPSPVSERLVRELAAAGIPAQVSSNVRGALWSKLVINCAYNALSAIVQKPYGWLVQQDGALQLIDNLVAECLAVAQAEGVEMADDIHAAVQGIAASMPGQLSSTAQDLARGHPSEIEHLNGHIVRRGAALSVATPVNQAMLVLVRMLETLRPEAASRP
ncbi:2-dehydropantoate 2-reductase [Comamonas faecalis]